LLRGGQYLLIVLALARCANNVIAGSGDGHFVITEDKGELTLPQKLLVLPAADVIIRTKPGEPVGNEVVGIAVFGKEIVAAATVIFGDKVVPVDAEGVTRPRFERSGQIDAHHGLVDRVFKRTARLAIFHRRDSVPELIGCLLTAAFPNGGQVLQLGKTHAALVDTARAGDAAGGAFGKQILVELEPDKPQFVGRVVVVRNRF